MSMRFKRPANPDLTAAAQAGAQYIFRQRRDRARGAGRPKLSLVRGAIGALALLTAATAAALTGQVSTAATAPRQTLTGTAGLAEQFVYSDLGQANGSIVGFTPDEDLLDVAALLAARGYAGTDPFADGTLTLTARRGSVYVSVDPDGRAGLLRAVTLTRLDGLAADALDPARDVRWRLDDGLGDPEIPWMEIAIYNNDPDYNLYPVLTTGTSGSDLWLRAWFGITNEQANKAVGEGKPYFPKPNNFRIYVNPTGTGIAPGHSVVLRLPLITQLVPDGAVDRQAPDQYIDWWGGGRVELFAAPVADRGTAAGADGTLYQQARSDADRRRHPADRRACSGMPNLPAAVADVQGHPGRLQEQRTVAVDRVHPGYRQPGQGSTHLGELLRCRRYRRLLCRYGLSAGGDGATQSGGVEPEPGRLCRHTAADRTVQGGAPALHRRGLAIRGLAAVRLRHDPADDPEAGIDGACSGRRSRSDATADLDADHAARHQLGRLACRTRTSPRSARRSAASGSSSWRTTTTIRASSRPSRPAIRRLGR